MIDYTDPSVIERQNIAPNAACGSDGQFYDVRNLLFLANSQQCRIEALEAQLAKATEVVEASGRKRGELEAKLDEYAGGFRLKKFENGQFDFIGGPVPHIANYFAEMMEADEGKYFNNMEIAFFHPNAGEMILTAQRVKGKTPAQQRKEAEAKLAQAVEAIAILEDALQEAGDDYPGSKMQELCQQQVKRARATLAAIKGEAE